MRRLISCLAVFALAVPAIFANSADATEVGLPTFSHNGRGLFGTGKVDVDVVFNSVGVELYNVIVDLSVTFGSNETWEVDVIPAAGTLRVDYIKDIGNSGLPWSQFRVEAIGAAGIFSLGGTPVPIAEDLVLSYDLTGLGNTFHIDYAVLPASPYSLHLTPTPVPEPSAFLLAALGLLGIAWRRRKRA